MEEVDVNIKNDDIYVSMGLVKFVAKQYEDDFRNGKLYMKNLQYYIDEERRSGLKGIGDVNEGSLVLNEVQGLIKDAETGKLIAEFDAEQTTLSSNNLLKSPVLCLYTIDSTIFKITNRTDTSMDLEMNITEEQLKLLTSVFGDNLLFIDGAEFKRRVKKACEQQGLELQHGKVKYKDYSINHVDRIEKMQNIFSTDMVFFKDKHFQYQNEYRFIIKNKIVDDHFCLDVGDLSDIITDAIDFKKLFNNEMAFEVRFGK